MSCVGGLLWARCLCLTAHLRPPPHSATESATGERTDGRSIRRSLNKTGRYVRQPTKDDKSQQLMDEHGVGYSSSGLVAQMRESGNVWQQGDVKVKLAKAYGYCWGVERAVRMAYEARNAKKAVSEEKYYAAKGSAGSGAFVQEV